MSDTPNTIPSPDDKTVDDVASTASKMPDTKAESDKPKYDESEEYADPTADVHLVSSDLTRFRVHSYQLMAHSTVFRAMFAHCAKPGDEPAEVLLVDPDIETKTTVKVFLDLIYSTGRFDVKRAENDALFAVIKLVNKYDCLVIRDLIIARLRCSIYQKACAFKMFAAGAIIDDIETCRLAIPFAATETFPGADADPLPLLDTAVPGGRALDVATLSDFWWDSIPTRHLRALMRATYRKSGARPTDWDVVANEFYRQMTKKEYKEEA